MHYLMRCPRLWWIAGVIMLCGLPSLAAAWSLPRSDLVPGGIAIVPLEGGRSQQPMAYYNGQRVMVLYDTAGWLAVVGIPLSTVPGTQELEVRYDKSPAQTRAFIVRDKQYAEQRLTVKNKRMVDPSPEDLQRIEHESARTKAALAQWSEGNALEKPFRQAQVRRFVVYHEHFGCRHCAVICEVCAGAVRRFPTTTEFAGSDRGQTRV